MTKNGAAVSDMTIESWPMSMELLVKVFMSTNRALERAHQIMSLEAQAAGPRGSSKKLIVSMVAARIIVPVLVRTT